MCFLRNRPTKIIIYSLKLPSKLFFCSLINERLNKKVSLSNFMSHQFYIHLRAHRPKLNICFSRFSFFIWLFHPKMWCTCARGAGCGLNYHKRCVIKIPNNCSYASLSSKRRRSSQLQVPRSPSDTGSTSSVNSASANSASEDISNSLVSAFKKISTHFTDK